MRLRQVDTDCCNAHADGAFYSNEEEATLYNPYKDTQPTSTVTPTSNKVVGFTVKLDQFDHGSFYTPIGSTGMSAAQLYTFNLDGYLQATVSPLAYSRITGDHPGSLVVQTEAVIPYNPSDPTSSANAAAAVTNLQGSGGLASSSTLSSIFDPATFGTSSVVGTLSVSGMM